MNSEQEKITASKALKVKIPLRSKKILALSYIIIFYLSLTLISK